jgi:hypothetical protein
MGALNSHSAHAVIKMRVATIIETEAFENNIKWNETFIVVGCMEMSDEFTNLIIKNISCPFRWVRFGVSGSHYHNGWTGINRESRKIGVIFNSNL